MYKTIKTSCAHDKQCTQCAMFRFQRTKKKKEELPKLWHVVSQFFLNIKPCASDQQ